MKVVTSLPSFGANAQLGEGGIINKNRVFH